MFTTSIRVYSTVSGASGFFIEGVIGWKLVSTTGAGAVLLKPRHNAIAVEVVFTGEPFHFVPQAHVLETNRAGDIRGTLCKKMLLLQHNIAQVLNNRPEQRGLDKS